MLNLVPHLYVVRFVTFLGDVLTLRQHLRESRPVLVSPPALSAGSLSPASRDPLEIHRKAEVSTHGSPRKTRALSKAPVAREALAASRVHVQAQREKYVACRRDRWPIRGRHRVTPSVPEATLIPPSFPVFHLAPTRAVYVRPARRCGPGETEASPATASPSSILVSHQFHQRLARIAAPEPLGKSQRLNPPTTHAEALRHLFALKVGVDIT